MTDYFSNASCTDKPVVAINMLLRVTAAILATCLAVACRPAGDGRMNLVMICVDTVRADRFYDPGIEDDLTDYLEIAQRYTQSMSTAPWTIPAVASVITGLYPATHGAGRFEGPVANLKTEVPSALNENLETLAEVLRDQGYQTQGIVAHPWFASGFGLEQGFEEMQNRGEGKLINEAFFRWLTHRDRQKPYFAYLHYMEAHDWHRKQKPAQMRDVLAAYDDETRKLLNTLVNPTICRNPDSRICIQNQIYSSAVLYLRGTIARLLSGLDERGELENTLIILYSDHGEAFRENVALHKQLYEDPRGIYGGGHGQAHFEQLLRVPLVAWHPEFKGAGHDQLVSLVDVFPSVLNWLNVTASREHLPGKLLASGPDMSVAIDEDRVVYASNISFGPESVAIISEQTKAWYWPDTDRFMFFDRTGDSGEKLLSEDDRLVLEFATLAGDYLEMQSDHETVRPELNKKQLQELQSIGYLQGAEVDKPPAKEN